MQTHFPFFFFCFFFGCLSPAIAQESAPDPSVLVGEWQLDMTPQNELDDNFAKMIIRSVDEGSLMGTFYRDGVRIREGRINTQSGVLYGALVSGDNSGIYNTAFYYRDGKLHGSTHALGREFLSVWVAAKVD